MPVTEALAQGETGGGPVAAARQRAEQRAGRGCCWRRAYPHPASARRPQVRRASEPDRLSDESGGASHWHCHCHPLALPLPVTAAVGQGQTSRRLSLRLPVSLIRSLRLGLAASAAAPRWPARGCQCHSQSLCGTVNFKKPQAGPRASSCQ